MKHSYSAEVHATSADEPLQCCERYASSLCAGDGRPKNRLLGGLLADDFRRVRRSWPRCCFPLHRCCTEGANRSNSCISRIVESYRSPPPCWTARRCCSNTPIPDIDLEVNMID